LPKLEFETFLQRLKGRIEGKSLHDLFCIEIFSGSGRLTAAVRLCGMKESYGVDHLVSKHVRSPTLKLDLNTEDGRAVLLQLLEDPDLCYIHMAPPCGTSSRARDLRRRYGYDPPQLRTELQPDGLPNLPPVLAKRVQLANSLYHFTGIVARRCYELGILFSIENPWRSHFWATSHFSKHVQDLVLQTCIFDHCMFGSRRAKRTKLLHVINAFKALNVTCDNSHVHEKWGYSNNSWATAEETAYPFPLCKAMAYHLCEFLFELGCHRPSRSIEDTTNDLQLQKVFAGAQPKGKRVLPLVPEFKNVVKLFGPPSEMPPQKLKDAWTLPQHIKCDPPLTLLPAGSRVIRAHMQRGDVEALKKLFPSDSDMHVASVLDESDLFDDVSNTHMVNVVGIPWSVEEFIEKAATSRHPKMLVTGLDSDIKDLVDHYASSHLGDIMGARMETLRRWMRKAVECMDEEKKLKEEMPEHCKKILQKKRLVLFGDLIREVGHEDGDLHMEVAKGFDLSGPIPRSGVYRKRKKPGNLGRAELRRRAGTVRKAIVASTKGSGDDEIDMAVFDVTTKEKESGWLHGPYSLEELPHDASVTRRFGIRQGGKVRPIDNFTESMVNLTASAGETIELHGTDTIAAIVAYWMETMTKAKCGSCPGLKVKTWDLKKAYKQLRVSTDGLNDSYLAEFDPGAKKTLVYGQYVLPFGACASVHAFCRTSYAMWKIGLKGLKILWSTYFDDYVVFCREEEQQHIESSVNLFFQLLGWVVSEDKSNAFDHVTKALGLVIDLSDCQLLKCRICNTEERQSELKVFLDEVLASRTLTQKDGERLRGRMIFAEAQIFGRRAAKAMGVLSQHVTKSRSKVVGDELAAALTFLRDKIVGGRPREIGPFTSDVCHIYTDASFELGNRYPVGIGGVMVCPVSGKRSFFSVGIQAEDLAKWNPLGSENPIFEFETLAVYIACRVWSREISGRAVVVFTDNEGSLGALIRCRCENLVGMRYVERITDLEDTLQVSIWYERVNTASNIADAPSRFVYDEFSLGQRRHVDLNKIFADIGLSDFHLPSQD